MDMIFKKIFSALLSSLTTRRVHETGRIYDTDLADIKNGHDRILDAVEEVVKKVSVLK